ncbi:hypothetical protein F5Y13DRAFT_191245 [Hypoxylon sp. FL1857]|nr:hypothetical protein F5Y13DRAFT_191245 [Hypoxylon sp. FL1857]
MNSISKHAFLSGLAAFLCLAVASPASAAATLNRRNPAVSANDWDPILKGDKNAKCADLAVIFARGTFDQGNLGPWVGGPFQDALVAGSKSVNIEIAVQGVSPDDYPADLAGYIEEGGSNSCAKGLGATVQKYFSHCPSSKIAIWGWSQGALCAHKALGQVGNAAANVIALGVFGDPIRVWQDDVNYPPVPKTTKLLSYCEKTAPDPLCSDVKEMIPTSATGFINSLIDAWNKVKDTHMNAAQKEALKSLLVELPKQATGEITQLGKDFSLTEFGLNFDLQFKVEEATPEQSQMHVLIAGGGIVGLTIAQGCRENNIPYTVFERDTEETRRHGWSLTLHWCLNALKRTIGPEAAEKLPDAVVDKSLKSGAGNFLFLNCETAGIRYKIPPSRNRLRLHRQKLRDILEDGINIQEGKKLVSVELVDTGVRAHFEDGTFVDGTILVGADGNHSNVRKYLLPDDYALNPLPVNLIGVVRHFTPDQAAPVRALDPLLFQGLHPGTGNFLWYSIHDSFEQPDGEYSYDAQVIISWIVKDPVSDDIPETNRARIGMMKQRASSFAEPLRSIVMDIPDDLNFTTAIKLADYPSRKWDNQGGHVTLAGDSAHAMTMYRGEGANHGILDAALLVDQLKKIHRGELDQKTAIDLYEDEMIPRTLDAVLKSRQAALVAHDWDAITEDSPIVGARLPPSTA